jgi:hypothetical protein
MILTRIIADSNWIITDYSFAIRAAGAKNPLPRENPIFIREIRVKCFDKRLSFATNLWDKYQLNFKDWPE